MKTFLDVFFEVNYKVSLTENEKKIALEHHFDITHVEKAVVEYAKLVQEKQLQLGNEALTRQESPMTFMLYDLTSPDTERVIE